MGRILLIPLCLVIMGATDCSHSSPKVKVWEFIPEESARPLKGWYRDEGKEVTTFGDTDVKYGVSANDMEFILNKLKQCEDIPNSVANKTIIDYLLSNPAQ